MRLSRVYLLTPLLVLSLFVVSSRVISAQSIGGAMQIEPTFQEVIIHESTESAEVVIKLTNTTDIDQEFEVLPVDILQFDSDGRVILADKPLTDHGFSLASFIRLTSDQVSIPRQSSVSIPLTIVNAQTLSPGGHYASIVIRLRSALSENQVLLPAVSTFILVRKEGGERYHLSLKKSELLDAIGNGIPAKTELVFSNQGNTHVVPRGSIEIKDFLGRVVAKSIVNESSLYVFPGTERILQQELSQVQWYLPLSLMFVQIQGTSQPGNVAFSQVGWYISIQPLGCILVAILILASILFYRLVRRKKKHDTKT